MKEVTLKIECTITHCSFEVEHVIYTNEYGYFAIPEMYCPNCFCKLIATTAELPKDIIEVKNANKR